MPQHKISIKIDDTNTPETANVKLGALHKTENQKAENQNAENQKAVFFLFIQSTSTAIDS